MKVEKVIAPFIERIEQLKYDLRFERGRIRILESEVKEYKEKTDEYLSMIHKLKAENKSLAVKLLAKDEESSVHD